MENLLMGFSLGAVFTVLISLVIDEYFERQYNNQTILYLREMGTQFKNRKKEF